jgi:hypothetical protein
LEGGGLWEMIRSWESPWMQLVSIRKNFQKTPLPILPWEVIARGLHLQTRNQHQICPHRDLRPPSLENCHIFHLFISFQ